MRRRHVASRRTRGPPNDRRHRARTRCDPLVFIKDRHLAAPLRGPVPGVLLHIRARSFSTVPALLSATASLCLRQIGRPCAPMNTHANGGGSVQLGSIRNPDLRPSTRTLRPLDLRHHYVQRHRRIPDRASDVRRTQEHATNFWGNLKSCSSHSSMWSGRSCRGGEVNE